MRKKKKKKPTTVSTFGKKACKIICKYARLRDTDINGVGYCCSCGKRLSWSEGQGGHFQPVTNSYNLACVDERNVHLQCSYCNCAMAGNPAGYAQFMLDKYGKEVIEEIKILSKQPPDKAEKLCTFFNAIEKYTDLCHALAEGKNFSVRV